MKSPLVSIIINCHNGEKYLAECINSVLKQTYKNWEIVFWNNKSNDKSLKIVKSFKNKKIKIFNSKNFLSLYRSRNLAIKKAKGKFIAFLDTDDLWVKKKLENQISLIKKNKKIKIIYSNYFVKNELKNRKFIKHKKKLPEGSITQKLIDSHDVGILTALVNKNIFNNYSFNNSYTIIGDFDFFLRTSLKYKFLVIQKPLAIYRLHKSNFSKIYINKYFYELNYWVKKNKKKELFRYYSFFKLDCMLFKLKIKYLYFKIINFLGV
jgi:glycosyltransferase involved in cell wall biosynthesis